MKSPPVWRSKPKRKRRTHKKRPSLPQVVVRMRNR